MAEFKFYQKEGELPIITLFITPTVIKNIVRFFAYYAYSVSDLNRQSKSIYECIIPKIVTNWKETYSIRLYMIIINNIIYYIYMIVNFYGKTNKVIFIK